MKILITGGNGYVAKSLYSSLSKKYQVTTITRQDFDLTNPQDTSDWLSDKYFDVVIHTATAGGSRLKPDDDSVLSNNLKMFYNLVDNDQSFGRLISFGSGAELYASDKPYGFSKKVIADAIRSRENYYNIRIYAVFDENELDTRFIKSNLYRYINKENIVIHQDKFMDFFYMKDLISLVDYYITALDPMKEIDCCYTYHPTLGEVAGIINNLNDYKIDVNVLSDGFSPPYTGNYAGMVISLIGLEQGIKNVYSKLK
jgi:nucleoside-diphosphate-sugar epimerase